MKTICLDFDGVLNVDPQKRYYYNSIQGELPNGAYEAVHKLANNSHFEVVILTARTDLENVSRWLYEKLGIHFRVTNQKPPAIVYVDDRAFRYEGNWEEVVSFIAKLQKD